MKSRAYAAAVLALAAVPAVGARASGWKSSAIRGDSAYVCPGGGGWVLRLGYACAEDRRQKGRKRLLLGVRVPGKSLKSANNSVTPVPSISRF